MTAVAPPHLDHVAKTLGRDDPDATALALDERVGGDRSAVHDRVEVSGASELPEPVEEADRLIAAVRRNFGDAQIARRLVVAKEIRERAADVDADDRPRGSAHA